MSKALLDWYDNVKRDLPWRQDSEPYKVWISEIMLQQTQVVTVIDYFNRFISKYPDVLALSKADESDVFKLWEGLGYYSRARNLMRSARIIADEFDGVFPCNSEGLQKLPGIGPYTAGAIASIAFSERVSAVDGNVLRVIARLYLIALPINQPKNLTVFRDLAMALMTERPGDFNQALMELGAMICTPRNPACEACPLSDFCMAFKTDSVEKFPVIPPKPLKREVNLGICIIFNGDNLLITKNSNNGLLANLWVFPSVELDDQRDEAIQIAAFLEESYGIVGTIVHKQIGRTHIFTHLKWKPVLYFLYVDDKISIEFPTCEWTTLERLSEKALPTAYKKQINSIQEGFAAIKNKKSEG
jgi:A/G-specific adenine glycosylase